MKSLSFALVFVVSSALSQEAYKIPFGSEGNTIELTIANTSSATATKVTAEAIDAPSWIKFGQRIVALERVGPNEEKSATFTFSLDKLAPVNQQQSLSFVIKSAIGESWTKEIKIKVAPPDKFELFQNYPNPFNPTTTICYQLTNDSRVTLKIYNLLGQEVLTLVDADKQAGYHQEVLNASRLASGMYVYRIVYTNNAGKRSSDKKTMLLVK
jgi:hypothetical protein